MSIEGFANFGSHSHNESHRLLRQAAILDGCPKGYIEIIEANMGGICGVETCSSQIPQVTFQFSNPRRCQKAWREIRKQFPQALVRYFGTQHLKIFGEARSV